MTLEWERGCGVKWLGRSRDDRDQTCTQQWKRDEGRVEKLQEVMLHGHYHKFKMNVINFLMNFVLLCC